MAEKTGFREKLGGIVELCIQKGGVIDQEEVEAYFQDEQLSHEQIELVYDYLLSQKIVVRGYIKRGGVLSGAEEQPETVLSDEERQYLRMYEEDLKQMAPDDPMAARLPKIVEMAKRLHRPEVFLGDLIQEGNMGLVLAMAQESEADAEEREAALLRAAQESMQSLLESQSEEKLRDKRMAKKVSDLESQIKKLTDELGRKVSVDELAEYMKITEEEIEDILKLAGE